MFHVRVAVLMTCHNRKDVTLACLNRLFYQKNLEHVDLKVYLVDDGSTDGTGEAVSSEYPDVILLNGDGSLYWCGGMRYCFEEAIKKDFDYYLWLNDDAMLFPLAVSSMLATYTCIKNNKQGESIVVGSMICTKSGQVSYGGAKRSSWLNPLKFELIEPTGQPVVCDVINGNCVMIPRCVVATIGNLSSAFTHGAGDYDYSLRARKSGYLSWVAPEYVGSCSRNPLSGTCKDSNLSIGERLKKSSRPNELIPPEEWMVFTKRHGGTLWPIYWFRTYLRKKFPWLWVVLRSAKKTDLGRP